MNKLIRSLKHKIQNRKGNSRNAGPETIQLPNEATTEHCGRRDRVWSQQMPF